jgi:hypothetical protein
MVDNNVPLKDAQYQMGHSTARMRDEIRILLARPRYDNLA